MKSYRVEIVETRRHFVEVRAGNEDAAMERALLGGGSIESLPVECQFLSVEEVGVGACGQQKSR